MHLFFQISSVKQKWHEPGHAQSCTKATSYPGSSEVGIRAPSKMKKCFCSNTTFKTDFVRGIIESVEIPSICSFMFCMLSVF